MKTHIPSQVLVNEGLHSIQSVNSSSVPCTVHGGKTDPLHFPDMTECEAVGISSEHWAAVGEEVDKLCFL